MCRYKNKNLMKKLLTSWYISDDILPSAPPLLSGICRGTEHNTELDICPEVPGFDSYNLRCVNITGDEY